jgi:predicted MFS family arabinose efflux permease
MTLQIWAAFFLSFAALYFLMSWIPKLMENAGFDVADGRQAFFLFNLGAVFGIYLLAFLSTRWRLTNIIAVFASLAALGMTLFANLAGDLDSALMIILLIGVFQQGAFTGLYSVAAKAYPTEVRSTGIGWAIGLGRSGAVFGPAAAGYLIAGGLDMDGIFIVFAIQLALSAIFAWWLRIS